MSVRPGSSRARVWVAAIAVAGFIAAVAAPGSAASSFSGLKQRDGLIRLSQRELASNAAGKVAEGEGGEARSEILDAAESFAAPRNLPAEFGDADVGAARLAAVERGRTASPWSAGAGTRSRICRTTPTTPTTATRSSRTRAADPAS